MTLTVEQQGVPWTKSIGLGGHSYDVEISKLVRQTLPILRPQVQQSDEPGEQAISYENVWPRSQHDWRLGSGQPYFDEDDANRHRFSQSYNIDPWDHRKLRLLPATTLNLDLSATAGVMTMSMAGSVIYATMGVKIRKRNVAGSSWQTVDDNAFAILRQAASGANVYFFTANGVYVIPIAQASPAPTLFSAFAATSAIGYTIGVANGRLLAGNGTRLVEIDSLGAYGAAGQLDFTHPEGRAWVCITGAPNGIYVGSSGTVGSGGAGSDIYILTVNPNTGGLVPTHAAEMPEGELIQVMLHYGGVMVLGTNRGIRLANISGDGSLIYGPLVKLGIQDPDSTPAITPGCAALHGRGEFVWFGWTDVISGYSGVGRLDLSKFTQPLVGAYAPDSLNNFGASAFITCGVATCESFTTSDIPAYVYWAEGSGHVYGYDLTTKASTGWMRTGRITFGTTEKKTPVAIDWRTDPLPAGSSVQIEIATDSGGFAVVATDTTTGSTGPATPVAISGISKAEVFELRFTLTRGTDTTTSPVIHSWILRAMPTPPRVDEILLPIILHGTVDPDSGMEGLDNAYDTWAEFQFLKNLEAAGTVVDLVIGSETAKVRVDQILMSAERVIGGTNFPVTWNDDHTFFNCPLTVRCLTVVPLSVYP